jgi:hypothetical protein
MLLTVRMLPLYLSSLFSHSIIFPMKYVSLVRLNRLSLGAPPSSALYVLALTRTLLRKHVECMPLIQVPKNDIYKHVLCNVYIYITCLRRHIIVHDHTFPSRLHFVICALHIYLYLSVHAPLSMKQRKNRGTFKDPFDPEAKEPLNSLGILFILHVRAFVCSCVVL